MTRHRSIARPRLDRFGRVADQRWTDGSGADVARLKYAYDLNSNPTGRVNTLSAGHGEKYTYDALDRLATFDRGTVSFSGTMNSTVTLTGAASRSQSWTLDALGNWGTLTTNGTAVARVHDSQNRMTSVGSTSYAYDANGNRTADGSSVAMTYDAWNRLVKWDGPGANNYATYAYDAVGRRPTRTYVSKSGVSSGTTYLSGLQDQILVENGGTDSTKYEYVWSAAYVFGLVCRDRPAGNNGEVRFEASRAYAEQDANWNVVATLRGSAGSGGTVTWDAGRERYESDPYGGNALVLNDNFTAKLGGSDRSWTNLFQGGFTDPLTGLVHFGAREYDPATGRWLQQDPLGYPEGPNRYEFVEGEPVGLLDPEGLLAARQAGPDGPASVHQWAQRQRAVLEAQLKRLCKSADSTAVSRCVCTPEKCAAQATALASAIVGAIEQYVLANGPARGGCLSNWGNVTCVLPTNYECGDWQFLVVKAIQSVLDPEVSKSDGGSLIGPGSSCFNALQMSASGFGVLKYGVWQHQWVRIISTSDPVQNALNPPVDVDPWPSGGNGNITFVGEPPLSGQSGNPIYSQPKLPRPKPPATQPASP